MNEIKTQRPLTTAPQTHRSKRIKSYAVLNSNSHKKQKVQHSLVRQILELENNEVSPPLTKGKQNNKPYKQSCRFEVKSTKKTGCLEEETRISNYAGFAKIMDGKDEKIGCLEVKIAKLEGKLRQLGLSSERKSELLRQKQDQCYQNQELKVKICQLLQGTQNLCRQKESLIKKNKKLCYENEELTVMIATLKQEYSESQVESQVERYERIEEISNELTKSKSTVSVYYQKLKETENEVKVWKELYEQLSMQQQNANIFHTSQTAQENKKIQKHNNETEGINCQLNASFMISQKLKLCQQESQCCQRMKALEQLLSEKNNKINDLDKKLSQKAQQMQQDSNKSQKLQKYVKKMEHECSELLKQNQRIIKSVQKQRESKEECEKENEKMSKTINEKNIQMNTLNAEIHNLQIKLNESQAKCSQTMQRFEQATKLISIQNQQHMQTSQSLSQIHQLETTIKQRSFQFKIQLNQHEQTQKLLLGKLSLEKAEKENVKKHNAQLQYQIRNLEQALQQQAEHIAVLNQNHKNIVDQFHAKVQQQQMQQKQVANRIQQLQNLCTQQNNKISELTNLNAVIGKEKQCLQQTFRLNQYDQQAYLKIQKQMKAEIEKLNEELNKSKQILHESEQQLFSDEQAKISNIKKIEELQECLRQTKYKLTEEQRIKQTLAYEQRKQIETIKISHAHTTAQLQQQLASSQALRNEIHHQQAALQTYHQSQELLFANYEQSLQINAQKDKVIQQLRNECHKKSMLEAVVCQNKSEEQICISNFQRIKEQMETISKNYEQVQKQLKQANQKNDMINSCLNQLEHRIMKQKEYSQELCTRLTEKQIENCALLRKEEHMRSEKKQLEQSVKFLSEQLGIWSLKYENITKDYQILKEEMGSMKTASKLFQKESKTSFQNNNSSVSMKSKQRASKEIQRNLQNYKLEIKILKQEKQILTETMETQLNKRKQMIECLIKEKNMLYEQMTTRALYC